MSNIFSFGEKIDGYDVRVLNEREARAGAGILLLFAAIAFSNAILISDLSYIKIVVIAFLIDFFIRVIINPKFAPSLIMGRLAVKSQKPEYVGAPQKRFAWTLGLALAIIMFVMIVIFNSIGIFNLIICLLCLTLLFLETSFGICIGCKLYNMVYKGQAKLCPGGACEIRQKHAIQNISLAQILIVILFTVFMLFIMSALT